VDDPVRRQPSPRRLARRKQAARRRRNLSLRYRVVAISVGLFALLWAMIGGQMAVGNDPVLGSKGSTTGAKKPPRASKPAQPPSQSSQFNDPGTQLAIDPRTGQVVVVPAPSSSGSSSPPDSGSSSSSSSASQAAAQPSYTPPPVTSSTS
jgi:hypothetical protein